MKLERPLTQDDDASSARAIQSPPSGLALPPADDDLWVDVFGLKFALNQGRPYFTTTNAAARNIASLKNPGPLLFFAMRELYQANAQARISALIIVAISETHAVESLGGGHGVVGDLRDQRHILECGQTGDQIVELKNKPDMFAAIPGQLTIVRSGQIVISKRHIAARWCIGSSHQRQQELPTVPLCLYSSCRRFRRPTSISFIVPSSVS